MRYEPTRARRLREHVVDVLPLVLVLLALIAFLAFWGPGPAGA